MLERRAGIAIHLNNIDAVSDSNPDAVRRVFDETREFLTMPGLTTLLCASPSFRDDVLSERQRLLDRMDIPAVIEPLPANEFIEAVHARYDHFADAGMQPPVEDAALAHIYELFEGDIRNTFQLAKSAALYAVEVRGDDATTVTAEHLPEVLATTVERAFHGLSGSEQLVVQMLLDHEVETQREIQETLGMPQPTVSQAVGRLETKRWVRSTKSGVRKGYRIYGFGALMKELIDSGAIEKPSEE